MQPIKLGRALLGMTIVTVSCTADRVPAPAKAIGVASLTPGLYTAPTAQDPISVYITGPRPYPVGPNTRETQTYTYTATIEGGAGPYYVVWKIRYCQYTGYIGGSGGEWIECQHDYGGMAEGPNLTSADHEWLPDVVQADILVELRESRDGFVTGVGGTQMDGPAFWRWGFPPENGTIGDPGFKCRGGGYLWPQEKYVYLLDVADHRWVQTGQRYRRDSCSGIRDFADTSIVRDTLIYVGKDTIRLGHR
jgi:hypothetical protein